MTLSLALAAFACGDSTLRPSLQGLPPPTGEDLSGAPTGSGASGGGGTPKPPPPLCTDEFRLCSVELTYPIGSEQSVEVRGDFASDGWEHGVAMSKTSTAWHATIAVRWNQPTQYKFVIDGTQWIIDPNNPNTIGEGAFQNSVLAPLTCEAKYTCQEPVVPEGVYDWRDAVIYSVFVDRFHDADSSNNCTVSQVKPAANYAGGDWKGVTSKLNSGYFSDLGVNTLLLTDVVENYDGFGIGSDKENYSAYHGYWPSDVSKAEACLGTEADLKALVDAAHAKGMKVLLDYAMVHMHIESAIFSQHPEWFYPLSFNGGDCICDDSGVCPWNAQGHRCWFTRYLPHWNFTNADARAYSVGNVIDWVKRAGFDGIRADAIKHVDLSWLTALRAKLETDIHSAQSPKQRFYMVGETYDFGNRDYLRSFIDTNTKLDGQFDFPLRRVLLQTVIRSAEPMSNLDQFMASNDGYYGLNAVMSTWIGNHDLGRVIHQAERPSKWGEYDNGSQCAWSGPATVAGREPYERLANAFAVLMTSRGAPLVYYGDEIGLAGCGDPDNRRPMPWGGLSVDQQWLRSRVQKLGMIRAKHPALRRGSRTTVNVSSDVWVYKMSAKDGALYVAINRGDVNATANGLPSAALDELVEDVVVSGPAVEIPPRQARIFVAR